jgi:DNA-binding IclR family transcriptional regulator
VEVGEVTPGFTSVAAAVLDHTAHPVAGVAVTYPERGGSPRLRDRVAAEVTRTARAISHRIGGEAGTPRAVGDAGPGRS